MSSLSVILVFLPVIFAHPSTSLRYAQGERVKDRRF